MVPVVRIISSIPVVRGVNEQNQTKNGRPFTIMGVAQSKVILPKPRPSKPISTVPRHCERNFSSDSVAALRMAGLLFCMAVFKAATAASDWGASRPKALTAR